MVISLYIHFFNTFFIQVSVVARGLRAEMRERSGPHDAEVTGPQVLPDSRWFACTSPVLSPGSRCAAYALPCHVSHLYRRLLLRLSVMQRLSSFREICEITCFFFFFFDRIYVIHREVRKWMS